MIRVLGHLLELLYFLLWGRARRRYQARPSPREDAHAGRYPGNREVDAFDLSWKVCTLGDRVALRRIADLQAAAALAGLPALPLEQEREAIDIEVEVVARLCQMRDPDSGLWVQVEPAALQELGGIDSEPYQWIRARVLAPWLDQIKTRRMAKKVGRRWRYIASAQHLLERAAAIA